MKATSNHNIAAGLFFTFFIVACLGKALPIPLIVGNVITALIGVITLFYVCITERNSKTPTLLLLTVFGATSLMAVCMAVNGNASPEDLLWPVTYSGPIGILLTKEIGTRVFYFLFYAIAAFYLTNALLGNDPNSITAASSRNAISVNMLLLVVLLYFFQWQKKSTISLVPAIIAVLLCIYGEGRTGILVSVVLLIIILFQYLFRVKAFALFKIIVTFILVGVALFLISTVFSDALQVLFSRFDREGMDTIRYDIWSSYLAEVFSDSRWFIFGAPTDSSWLLVYYDGNLHNAFFMLHSRFGIIGFCLLCVTLLFYALYSIKKCHVFEVALLAVLILRSFYDWTAFTGLYDVLFIALMLTVFLRGFNAGNYAKRTFPVCAVGKEITE